MDVYIYSITNACLSSVVTNLPSTMSSCSDEFDLDSEFDSDLDDESYSVENSIEEAIQTLQIAEVKIRKLDEIKHSIHALTLKAGDMVGLSAGTVQLLLDAYNWSLTEMTASVIDDPDATAQKARLSGHTDFDLLVPRSVCGSGAERGKGTTSTTVCPVCLCEQSSFVSLGCEHGVCSNCFKKHVDIKMLGERCLFSTKCPGSADCPLILTRDAVVYLGTSQLVTQFDDYVAERYIDKLRDQFRRCPHPDCEYVAEKRDRQVTKSKSVAVECGNNHVFCFQCGLPFNHYAIPCDLATRWLAIVDHEHRSSLWITKNTKQCPQCETKIQRSEGCNQMKCTKCQYKFCWVCSRSWDEHSGKSYYNCVKFVPSTVEPKLAETAPAKSKKQRGRLDFYVLRYDNHAGLSDDVDDRTVREAHNLLAWAYVLLYCAGHSNNKIILEELITDLGRDIEESSPRLRQRTEALTDFLLQTPWTLDGNTLLI